MYSGYNIVANSFPLQYQANFCSMHVEFDVTSLRKLFKSFIWNTEFSGLARCFKALKF